ncbi:hypothetical protein [Paramicrobacterium agarici]|uniref:Uncharacterized protein n=1 Tax=Paramicrobacterium agarici TaxID=630514 RepID=A0A2A9DYS8_9MICO|nr:hypothetical protein [Microbacterium agarici]PFG31132.1 hypothetical protein ATJ78_2082 [Microbacterium agarici]
MTERFTLSDSDAVSDLCTFVGRAKRVDPDAVRLIASSGVLAVYVPVLYARGILDRGPTVLGLRTFAETSGAEFDRTVVPDAISERLARVEGSPVAQLTMPSSEVTAPWTGIAPPRSGWAEIGSVGVDTLAATSREGAARIAAELPRDAGDPVVQRIRAGVWGEDIPAFPELPAGAAFAAESLGFIGESETARVLQSGPWLRLSIRRGHVLVRRR